MDVLLETLLEPKACEKKESQLNSPPVTTFRFYTDPFPNR
jgi:hypothetical protein